MEILAGRVLIRPVDPPRSLAFYRDVLGLAVYREFPGGTVFFLGGGFLEVSGRRAPGEPWGLDEMWVADPDGLLIGVVEVPPEHPLRRDPRP